VRGDRLVGSDGHEITILQVISCSFYGRHWVFLTQFERRVGWESINPYLMVVNRRYLVTDQPVPSLIDH